MHAAPGWYPDPRGGDGQRYWTGESWAPDQVPPDAGAPGIWQRPDDPTAVLSSHPVGSGAGSAFGTGGPPPPPWRRATVWVALAAGLLAGFGGGFAVADRRADERSAGLAAASPSPSPGRTSSAAPTSPRPTPSRAPRPAPEPTEDAPDEAGTRPQLPAPPEDQDAPLLDRLGLRPTDVDPSVGVGLIPDGDKVVGETTLDLCYGRYETESRRTARRQLIAATSEGGIVMSTEAVLYDAPAATQIAFVELERTGRECAESGIDRAWPEVDGVDRLAFDVSSKPDGGEPGAEIRSTVVYLRRGRTLLALYFRYPGVTTTPVIGQSNVPAVTAEFEKRLAAMPPAGAVI